MAETRARKEFPGDCAIAATAAPKRPRICKRGRPRLYVYWPARGKPNTTTGRLPATPPDPEANPPVNRRHHETLASRVARAVLPAAARAAAGARDCVRFGAESAEAAQESVSGRSHRRGGQFQGTHFRFLAR